MTKVVSRLFVLVTLAASSMGCEAADGGPTGRPQPNTLGGACTCATVRCTPGKSTCEGDLTCLFGECVAEACEEDGTGCTSADTVCTIFGNRETTFHYCAWDGVLEEATGGTTMGGATS